jgi:intracellular septation protein A
MTPFDLLKTLAPGFLPLFAYLGAELIFGERVGLFVGIGLGVAEFLFRLIKDRKADLFALAETVLLAVMGALSLASGNSVYFRLKPALTEGLTALGMAVLLFLPDALLKEYFGRQVKGIEFGDEAIQGLRKNILLFVGVLSVHAGLTTWAALAASAALWGFVSGGLLYVLLGVVFVWRIVGTRRRARPGSAELLRSGPSLEWRIVLFDETGKIFAARPGRELGELWDDPLSGRASSHAEMQEKMFSGLLRLGFAGSDSGAIQRNIALRPLFLADGKGGFAATPPAPFDPDALFAGSGIGENWAVFAAVLPSALGPKGLDPTCMRFWPLADLAALKDGAQFSPDFSALVGSLALYRDSLRNRTPDL